jgi:hypothetical protein
VTPRGRRRANRLPSDRALGRVTDVRTYPRVRIVWRDSTSQLGWRPVDELRKDPALCAEVVSEGSLLRRTRKEWLVAATVSSDGGACDAIAIPVGCVRRVLWLPGGTRRR